MSLISISHNVEKDTWDICDDSGAVRFTGTTSSMSAHFALEWEFFDVDGVYSAQQAAKEDRP